MNVKWFLFAISNWFYSHLLANQTNQNKPVLVEPIDFEGFIAKNRTVIQNDPHRELLLYPSDDVMVSIELTDDPFGRNSDEKKFLIITFRSSQEIVQPKTFRTIIKDIPSVQDDVLGNRERQLGENAKNGHSLSAEESEGGGGGDRDTPGSPTSSSATVTPTNNHNNGILLTRQSLKTYSNDNHLIQYKYDAYGGSSLDIPKWVY